ncbi:hypothetical protein HDU97_010014 [Phlyctochytrium planicorne]|nr:hypothetical protein HDU97_010014 [Phlyctochytrium planicorne]
MNSSITTVAILIGTVLVYDIFFKKRRNASIPGPYEYPIVANAPIVIKYNRKKKSHDLRDMVRSKHGNIYKFTLFGLQLVIVSDAVEAKRILTGDEFFRTTVGMQFCEGIFRYGLFFLPSGDIWKRHRKYMQPGFGPSHLRDVVSASNQCCDALFQLWKGLIRDSSSTSVESDLFHVASCLTIDVIGKMAFSFDFESVHYHLDKDSLVQMKAYQKSFEVIARRIPVPKFLWSTFGIAPEQVAKDVDVMKSTIQAAIDQKRRRLFGEDGQRREDQLDSRTLEGMKHLDVLDRLMLSTDWSDEEIKDEVVALFLAGGETTANTIAFCVLLLHQHPNVLQKLLAELDEVFFKPDGDDEADSEHTAGATDFSYQKVSNGLKYTEAIVKEALRLHPVLHSSSGREVKPDEGVIVLGHRLEKGTIVQVDIRGVHRDPRYWDNPLQFNPDRWMDPDFRPIPGSYIPFSDGMHTCLGNKMAILEAKCFLARMYREFSFDLVEGQDLEPLSTVTHGLKNGLIMKSAFASPLPKGCSDKICIADFKPVCGSDGKTYSNICQLDVAKCKGARDLTIKSQGSCKKSCSDKICTADLKPVCGSDGKTYTNICQLDVAKCKLEASSNGARDLTVKSQGACKAKKSCDDKICTADFKPVCGSDGKTYTNICQLDVAKCKLEASSNGARDLTVKSQGACKKSCNKVCSADFEPVCGSDGKTYTNICQFEVAKCKVEESSNGARDIKVKSKGSCKK